MRQAAVRYHRIVAERSDGRQNADSRDVQGERRAERGQNPGSRIASKKFAATLELDELGKKIVYPPTEQYNKGLYLTVLDDSAMGLYDTAWTEFKQKASIQ